MLDWVSVIARASLTIFYERIYQNWSRYIIQSKVATRWWYSVNYFRYRVFVAVIWVHNITHIFPDSDPFWVTHIIGWLDIKTIRWTDRISHYGALRYTELSICVIQGSAFDRIWHTCFTSHLCKLMVVHWFISFCTQILIVKFAEINRTHSLRSIKTFSTTASSYAVATSYVVATRVYPKEGPIYYLRIIRTLIVIERAHKWNNWWSLPVQRL